MARATPDAATLLKEDHRKVEALFEQFEKPKVHSLCPDRRRHRVRLGYHGSGLYEEGEAFACFLRRVLKAQLRVVRRRHPRR